MAKQKTLDEKQFKSFKIWVKPVIADLGGQMSAARKLGIPQPNLSRYLNDNSTTVPDMDVLRIFAEHEGLTLEEFLSYLKGDYSFSLISKCDDANLLKLIKSQIECKLEELEGMAC